MARYSGARWLPIHPSYLPGARISSFNRMNLHVAAGEALSLWPFFNGPGKASSHFYVRYDGVVEQYVDTDYCAEADREGNDATISVETQGLGGGAWTWAQLESLAKLFAWSVRTHAIPNKVATDSKIGPSSHGLSWHRLGIDGNFPPLPSIRAGRLQRGGGMYYSFSTGKECPGNLRVDQVPEVFRRAQQYIGADATPDTTPEETDDMALTSAELEALLDASRPIQFVFFQNGPNVCEASLGTNQWWRHTSPGTVSTRRGVLNTLGVKWTNWRNAAGNSIVDNPTAAFGREIPSPGVLPEPEPSA